MGLFWIAFICSTASTNGSPKMIKFFMTLNEYRKKRICLYTSFFKIIRKHQFETLHPFE